mgnify:CR=1 FL=1
MKQILTIKQIILSLAFLNLLPSFMEAGKCQAQSSVKNAYIWADYPDPDIIRVGDYYYLVTTTTIAMPSEANWTTLLKSAADFKSGTGKRFLTSQMLSRILLAMTLAMVPCMAVANGLLPFAITKALSGLSS